MSSYAKGFGLKSTYKSPNFDRNKNANAMSSQANKNVYKISSIILTVAKQRFVPIATRETYNSTKMNKMGDLIQLSSINQPSRKNSKGRYFDQSSNKYYTTTRGAVPAGRNAGKNMWFERAFQAKKGVIRQVETESVLK